MTLIDQLNRAYADEWLAYAQYWLGAKVIEGADGTDAVAELTQHAADEARHAGLLADRILALGGVPLAGPTDWLVQTQCGYNPPVIRDACSVVRQNWQGEGCAIRVYSALLTALKLGDDTETTALIASILGDEVEHEEDLRGVLVALEGDED